MQTLTTNPQIEATEQKMVGHVQKMIEKVGHSDTAEMLNTCTQRELAHIKLVLAMNDTDTLEALFDNGLNRTNRR